jgi:glycosyltransferase involved in cell wall biosynthesis
MPETGGSEEVVRQLSERLAARGHEVTVATGASARRSFNELRGVKIVGFRCAGNDVEGFRGDSAGYGEFLLSGKWDVMMNYAAQIWSTDLVFGLLPSLRMKKVLVPCGYSRLNDPKFRSYFEGMPGILRSYDRVVYLSDNYIDTNFGISHGLQNGIVIPNGADSDEFLSARRGAFREKRGIGDRTLIINVSNHSQLKGHDFFWSCLRSMRDENVAAALIGSPYSGWPKKWFSECYRDCRMQGKTLGVPVLEDLPREEVVQAFTDADLFLFGSRVECSPLVMFEAFASKTLFVTTDCGNVRDYSHAACIVGSAEEAAGVIREYCRHPGRFTDRIEQGYTAFREKLNWDSIARQYEDLYLSLLK